MKKIIVMMMLLCMCSSVEAAKVTATFDYSNHAVDGFRLYDNYLLLCETMDPTVRVLTCDIDSKYDSHVFTITAFAGADESAMSSPYPMTYDMPIPIIGDVLVSGEIITATFTCDGSAFDGFRFYDNSTLLCEILDSTAETISCSAILGPGAHSFTLTTFDGNIESDDSLSYPLVITISAPAFGTVTIED